MPHIRERLKKAIDDAGLDMANLSRKLGKNQTYLQQYITRGTPRKLDADLRKELCGLIGKPTNFLEENYDQGQTASVFQASDKVPVYGYVAGAGERIALNDGSITAMRERPRSLEFARDGFLVVVIGISMEPRLFQGELVAVNPRLPPRKGQDCVIQFNDGEAVVKTYQSETEKKVVCSQYNPPKTIEYDKKEILAVSAVVSREDAR